LSFSQEELETTSVMMIPLLLDRINHSSNEPNAALQVMELLDDNDSSSTATATPYYAVVALHDISVGNEVTISYGSGEEWIVRGIPSVLIMALSPKRIHTYDVDSHAGMDGHVEETTVWPRQMIDWSTTLEANETRLHNRIEFEDKDSDSDAVSMDLSVVERTILEFWVHMKRAMKEWEELEDDEEWGMAVKTQATIIY
jgi:hypothetical protein